MAGRCYISITVRATVCVQTMGAGERYFLSQLVWRRFLSSQPSCRGLPTDDLTFPFLSSRITVYRGSRLRSINWRPFCGRFLLSALRYDRLTGGLFTCREPCVWAAIRKRAWWMPARYTTTYVI